MVTFKSFSVMHDTESGKQTVEFDGILLATKDSFELSEPDSQQLEFFEVNIYQTCDHRLIVQGFSPFCNENFFEAFSSDSDLDLNPLIQRIVGCIPIGDDQKIVENFMLKVKQFAESIFISEIVNVDSFFDTSKGIDAQINEYEHLLFGLTDQNPNWSHKGKAVIETGNHKMQLNIEWRIVRNTLQLQVVDFDFFGMILNNKENIKQIFRKLNSPEIIGVIYKKISAFSQGFKMTA